MAISPETESGDFFNLSVLPKLQFSQSGYTTVQDFLSTGGTSQTRKSEKD